MFNVQINFTNRTVLDLNSIDLLKCNQVLSFVFTDLAKVQKQNIII